MSDMASVMAEALKQSMPNLKTQGQFTAFMLAFDSFRLLCDSVCSRDKEMETQARVAFEKAIDAVRTSTELTGKFEEIPEENRGSASNPFTQPPAEFHEYDIQKKLLGELNFIVSIEALNEWYLQTKSDRDRVVSQTLRNVLLDSIRRRRETLQNKAPT